MACGDVKKGPAGLLRASLPGECPMPPLSSLQTPRAKPEDLFFEAHLGEMCVFFMLIDKYLLKTIVIFEILW